MYFDETFHDNCTMKKVVGILCDVLVKVESFIFLVDFVILDYQVCFDVLIIYGRSFLATGHALIDEEIWQIKFQLNEKQVTFNLYQFMKQQNNIHVIFVIDTVDEDELVALTKKRLGVKALAVEIMNFEADNIESYIEMVSALTGRGS